MQTLDDFFRHVQHNNPFFSNRVSEPTGGDVDVPSIHERQYRSLLTYAEQAWREATGIGVVVWGEPGSGKSHLLARLCRWADTDRHARYIFLHNIQASPERLPRYVLKCVVGHLTGGRSRRFHDTPLHRLVNRMVSRAVERFLPAGTQPTAQQAAAAYLRLAEERIAANCNAGADALRVYRVLIQFYMSAHLAHYCRQDERLAQLAVRWLSGDDLDAEEAEELGLGHPGPDRDLQSLTDDQAIESVLIALAEHARFYDQPLLLCFDQVDNLNDEQIRALGQFLHPLIEHAQNLLVITSGVHDKLEGFLRTGVLHQAAWERVAQDELLLTRISREQARHLLECRLEVFMEPFVQLPEVKRHLTRDALFPLGRGWFEERTREFLEIRPRDIINWARAAWREQQHRLQEGGGEAWLCQWHPPSAAPQPTAAEEPLEHRIDRLVEAKIRDQLQRRQLDAATLAPDSANLSGLVEELLTQHLQGQTQWQIARCKAPRYGPPPPCQLIVARRRGEREHRSGAAFIATASKTSAASVLRRLVDDRQPPDRVLLVAEARRPLLLGPKGQEYLDRLQSRGPARFANIEISFDEYAMLDALQAVVADARSGDLELEGPGGSAQRISEQEVIASHQRCNRYAAHRLLAMLLQLDAPGEPGIEPGPRRAKPERPAGAEPRAGTESPGETEPPGESLSRLPVAAPANGRTEANGAFDDEQLRAFIMARLALTMGMSTAELAAAYVSHGRLPPKVGVRQCQEYIERVARALHQEGRLRATPQDDNLYLLL